MPDSASLPVGRLAEEIFGIIFLYEGSSCKGGLPVAVGGVQGC